MHGSVRHVALVALLGAFLPAAPAEDPAPREIGLPREGFSVVLPAGWTLGQPVSALLEVASGPNATVWLRRDTGKGDDLAGRLRDLVARMAGETPGAKPPEPVAWKVKGAGESFRVEFPQGDKHAHGFALVSQPMGRRLEIEWVHRIPAAGATNNLQAVLDSLDVTPFANPQRYVDWTAGWSIDVPAGWERVAATEGRTVFEGDGLLAVRKLAAKARSEDFKAELDALVARREDLRVLREERASDQDGSLPLWEMRELGPSAPGAEQVRTHGAEAREIGGFLVACMTPLGEGESVRPGQSAPSLMARFESFRSPPDTGVRGQAAGPEESFARADAPKVVFRPPTRWKKVQVSPGMRIAQYEVPGAEPAECVVFFFGATQGGSLEANLERWKGQFEVEGSPQTKTEEVSKGVFATVLDVSGRYVAPIRPGAPEKHDKPGWRMLAAVVLAPDGPLYLKLVGPKSTIEPAADEFWAWVRSFRVKP